MALILLKYGGLPVAFNSHGVRYHHQEQPGTLTVKATVGGDTGFDTTRRFGFTVTFGSPIAYTVDGIAIPTASSTYGGTLAHGESVTLGEIPYGTTYSVTEDAMSSEATAAGYSQGSVTGGSGTMTEDGSVLAGLSYRYREPDSGSIAITRSSTDIYEGSSYVQLDLPSPVRYSIDGVTISEASSTVLLTLEKGQTVTVAKLPVGTYVFTAESPNRGSVVYDGYIYSRSSGVIKTRANYNYTEDGKITFNPYTYKDYQATAKVSIA